MRGQLSLLCALLAVTTPRGSAAQQRYSDIDGALSATPIGALVALVPPADSGVQLFAQFAASDLVSAGHQVVAIGADIPGVGLVVARTIPQGGLDGPMLSMGALRVGGWWATRHGLDGSRQRGGAELVAGVGRDGDHSSTTLGLRFPVELAASGRYGSLALTVTPAMGWGRLDLRECEDRGPGDNCGDLQVRLALGRTRYLLGAGVAAELRQSGLAMTAGVQRLFARGQPVRLAVGLMWRRRGPVR